MLRAYMGANELTQKALAKKIGVSASFLNDILLEKREPQGKVLEFLKLDRVVVYRRAHPTTGKP
jgi:transcriptional regulator with XRE-family HTH domain